MALHSLEVASGPLDDDGRPRRTGTLWSCVAHIITAVIGSGVLSLAWSTSQLGWVGGPVCLFCFAAITYVSASLLSDCYRSPDPVTGTRNYCYMDAVTANLSSKTKTWCCGLLQIISFYLTAIAYVITTGTCTSAILKSNCYHKHGHNAPCVYNTDHFMVLFGIIQVFMSMIPNVHGMTWLSVTAAIMSFTYAFIGFGLGVATVVENGYIQGSLTGVPAATKAAKIWLAFEAVGNIAFAYPYSLILLEIQDTVKTPPSENKVMKRASIVAIVITTFFYYLCGCFGYAAFGNNTPGNLLTGFGFYEPYWLVDLANACIIVHLIGGYQLYSQPTYALVERWLAEKHPDNDFVNKFYTLRLPSLPPCQINLLRLCFRTAYVVSTTIAALIFPYFNQVLGVLGAVNFWPLAIYFPVEMYIVQKRLEPWSRKWVILKTFSFICFLVTIIALIGSVEGLFSAKFG
ncbi:hypothetical protein ACFE04_024018 [Oxalis oulophora]